MILVLVLVLVLVVVLGLWMPQSDFTASMWRCAA
jgi:hypothetical protein